MPTTLRPLPAPNKPPFTNLCQRQYIHRQRVQGCACKSLGIVNVMQTKLDKLTPRYIALSSSIPALSSTLGRQDAITDKGARSQHTMPQVMFMSATWHLYHGKYWQGMARQFHCRFYSVSRCLKHFDSCQVTHAHHGFPLPRLELESELRCNCVLPR